MLRRGSAYHDWCEHNYAVTDNIAEFWNTISNVVIVVPALLSCHLYRSYAKHVSPMVYLVFFTGASMGIFSAYFHATLSLLGQLLDELSILWLIVNTYAGWFPKRLFPTWLQMQNGSRLKFQVAAVIFTILATALCLVYPALNPLFLLMLSPSAVAWLQSIRKRSSNAALQRVGLRCLCLWFTALACWLLDVFACRPLAFLIPFHIPLHAVWHALVGIALSLFIVCTVYADACVEVPHLNPQIAYWSPAGATGYGSWIGLYYVNIVPPLDVNENTTTTQTTGNRNSNWKKQP